ncbi:hypothetical protein BAAM1489_05735 [Bifidobacterium animalis subsp. animalis MCC 1489]|nr:hypothetical protein BAAM1489_05735 [Bifidobacterium animalis subsp. animalis MCC 1489]
MPAYAAAAMYEYFTQMAVMFGGRKYGVRLEWEDERHP